MILMKTKVIVKIMSKKSKLKNQKQKLLPRQKRQKLLDQEKNLIYSRNVFIHVSDLRIHRV